MLLHNILIFFFLLFILHPSLCLCYLIFSTLSFSCSFLFSKSSLFLFKFLTQILFFFFPIFFSLSSQFVLYYERVSSFVVWAIGVGVVGHRHHGHAVGMVGHQFWVMPWVWVCAMVFVGLALVGHWFYGFVGHAVGFV